MALEAIIITFPRRLDENMEVVAEGRQTGRARKSPPQVGRELGHMWAAHSQRITWRTTTLAEHCLWLVQRPSRVELLSSYDR